MSAAGLMLTDTKTKGFGVKPKTFLEVGAPQLGYHCANSLEFHKTKVF